MGRELLPQLGSRMSFLSILRVVYFPVKHSCVYNKKDSVEFVEKSENPRPTA